MAKISIHIPDETLAKVRRHKDRLNISKVCSQALLKEVETIANVPAMVEQTEKLIVRLREDLHTHKAESYSIGVSLAQSYLSKVSLEQLAYWGALTYDDRKRLVFPEEIEDYLEQYSLRRGSKTSLHRQSFTKGWLTVMNQTWKTAKDKI